MSRGFCVLILSYAARTRIVESGWVEANAADKPSILSAKKKFQQNSSLWFKNLSFLQ